VPSGYFAAVHPDPIEKKPFFHALPGARAMSFGMLGCDYHCAYCQNWLTSQTLRDPNAFDPMEPCDPEDFVDLAIAGNASVVTSTYNEPLITSEWAVEIFKLARRRGLVTSYVSNGNGTPEVIEYLAPWVDLFKVDLKSFSDASYRQLGGVLQRVLDTIIDLHNRRIWIEIVTLVVPGLNDSEEELREIASFVVGVSPDIPWHVTAFHPDYKMTDRAATCVGSVIRAAEIGKECGIRFVYAGNIPGQAGRYEHTVCPKCGELLIERAGYVVRRNNLRSGMCPACAAVIPGYWRPQVV
jgi:pyruvate formate lyase activating enzyme